MRTARRQRRILGDPRTGPVLLWFLVAIVVVLVVLLDSGGSSRRPSGRVLESMFQDDQMLVDNTSSASVLHTLDTLRRLGVDRLRITVNWSQVAPDSSSRTRPAGFDGADPASYPQTAASGWARYDRIDVLAAERGIAVDFDVSDPAPLWATGADTPKRVHPGVYLPSAREFGQFVTAVGKRYSGSYRITVEPGKPKVRLPRVSFWTIWNEPNQPGWLAPQYHRVAGQRQMIAPELYREYVDAAWSALHATGHGGDRILVGELAPDGCTPGRLSNCRVYAKPERPIAPITFLQALYCVNASYQRLRGATAAAIGCPASGTAAAFTRAHPALLDATAFTHHPYAFETAPAVPVPEPTFVALSGLGRLETALDRVFAADGSSRTIPLYLDEYGYETDPPNPIRGVSLSEQAAFIDQATYMAWRNPRVQGLSQFLLVDAAPDTAYPKGSRGYWSTFQTGLEYLSGKAKPSLAAYRVPVFLPDATIPAGGRVGLWAMLRPAPTDAVEHAVVQWRSRHGAFRTVARVLTTSPGGVIQARVAVPASGALRVVWVAPGGQTYRSRSTLVTVSG